METATPGFLNSFRVLGDSLLATVQDRLELFSVELQEEKFRLIQTFIWISAAVFTGMMAITFASLTLVYLFWESARLAVLGGLTVFYAGALVAIIIAFRRYIARAPSPFSATRQEIGEDRSCIRNGN
ncbi:MAG TPA: phage holin family protein [Opitutaceae bacterium]|nr:phage holin family protein [Opitutaceae bacterium]